MKQLKQIFADWAGVPCTECLALGAGGSARRYYRLVFSEQCSMSSEGGSQLNTEHCTLNTVSAIGCINDDIRENQAFFAYSSHFRSHGIHVPEIYAVASDQKHYLQQDLGDTTLYDLLYGKKRQGGGFDSEMLTLYKKVLADLADIQQAGADLDFSVAYPRPAFDRQSIMWDLNYFKYYYLKLNHIPFDEQLLENDFNTLADQLLEADSNYFLYRDFNPRNIMLVSSELYYIDFQGGRRGAAQYDVASLLYSAKSDLPQPIRNELLSHYLDVRNIRGAERTAWLHHFRLFLLVRILQTLGAYGYRGLYERKPYFIQSIPLALNNLRQLVQDHPETLDNLPELKNVIAVSSQQLAVSATQSGDSILTANRYPLTATLTVTVSSFSYKNGLPDDPSGNGGGHIFDCRALPNPGRYPEYKNYTGKDRPVIEFLQREEAVDRFLKNTRDIVAQSVDKYLERNFTHLMVSFGCTGGQHRSVYCTEQTAAWLRSAYPQINVTVVHREQQ